MAYKSCMPEDLRKTINRILNDIEMPIRVMTSISGRLSKIPKCTEDSKPKTSRSKNGGKKRAPSAYNQFMSTCLRSDETKRRYKVQTQRMSACASRWKKEKSK